LIEWCVERREGDVGQQGGQYGAPAYADAGGRLDGAQEAADKLQKDRVGDDGGKWGEDRFVGDVFVAVVDVSDDDGFSASQFSPDCSASLVGSPASRPGVAVWRPVRPPHRLQDDLEGHGHGLVSGGLDEVGAVVLEDWNGPGEPEGPGVRLVHGSSQAQVRVGAALFAGPFPSQYGHGFAGAVADQIGEGRLGAGQVVQQYGDLAPVGRRLIEELFVFPVAAPARACYPDHRVRLRVGY